MSEDNKEVVVAQQQSTVKLGFGVPPVAVQLYIENHPATKDNPPASWHYFEFGSDDKTPIYTNGLFGYITDVRIHRGEYDGKPLHNLRITVRADKQYIIQSGNTSVFAKGIMLALDEVRTSEDFKRPLCIEVKNGDKKVVFGNLYFADTSEHLMPKGDRERRTFPILQKVQEMLGVAVQSAAEVKAMLQFQPDNSTRGQSQPESSYRRAGAGTQQVLDRQQVATERAPEPEPPVNQPHELSDDDIDIPF
jgi:hypothetical protein